MTNSNPTALLLNLLLFVLATTRTGADEDDSVNKRYRDSVVLLDTYERHICRTVEQHITDINSIIDAATQLQLSQYRSITSQMEHILNGALNERSSIAAQEIIRQVPEFMHYLDHIINQTIEQIHSYLSRLLRDIRDTINQVYIDIAKVLMPSDCCLTSPTHRDKAIKITHIIAAAEAAVAKRIYWAKTGIDFAFVAPSAFGYSFIQLVKWRVREILPAVSAHFNSVLDAATVKMVSLPKRTVQSVLQKLYDLQENAFMKFHEFSNDFRQQ